MITEDYVSFELAKLLKERGFVVPYDSFRGVYINGKFLRRNPGQSYLCNMGDEIIDVCSIQMAMKWLRNTFHLEIYPYHNYDNSKWWYEIIKYPNSVAEYECGKDEELNTYEEACEEAIKYCLENLI